MVNSQGKWRAIVKIWRNNRAAQQLPAPGAPQPTTPAEHTLALLRVPRQPRKPIRSYWANRDMALNILVQYLEQIPKGQHATTQSYRAWAKQQPYRTPGLDAFRKHGSWAAMLELAHERMLEDEQAKRSDNN
jgi:hypothetical protein